MSWLCALCARVFVCVRRVCACVCVCVAVCGCVCVCVLGCAGVACDGACLDSYCT